MHNRADMESIAIKLCLSGMSSAVAETATFPIDLTKTRLQIQGEVATTTNATVLSRKGMFGTALNVIKEEGPTKLWSGATPAVLRQIIYTGIRMPAYEMLRESVFKRNPDGSFSVWKAIAAGSFAGVIGQFIATPMDLAKVKMQTQYHSQHATKSNLSKPSLINMLRGIYKARGVKGMWAGWVPSCGRAALVNIGNLATYDIAKQTILKRTDFKDDWKCHMAASSCSGLAAATLSTPVDVIKTRIMNQARDINGKGLYYTSTGDCFIKTITKEGFLSLYKGFVPNWLRIAPWSMMFWILNEELRRFIGMKGF